MATLCFICAIGEMALLGRVMTVSITVGLPKLRWSRGDAIFWEGLLLSIWLAATQSCSVWLMPVLQTVLDLEDGTAFRKEHVAE